MELVGNLKFAQVILLMMWLSTLLISMVSQAYPMSPSTAAEEDVYDSDRHVLAEIKWIRSLLDAPHEKMGKLKRNSDKNPEFKEELKRINFGFAGLDNLDFILTTLEKQPKAPGSNERDAKMQELINLMRANG